jgi:hypothetical protein
MTYLKRLEQGHRIEVNGEAVYTIAARLTSDPGRKAKWGALAELETRMKERLAAAIKTEGAFAREHALDVLLGRAIGAAAAAFPWTSTMRTLGVIARRTVRFWEQLEREHPHGDTGLLATLTAHERAQVEFAERELEGRGENSLRPILELLEKSAPQAPE